MPRALRTERSTIQDLDLGGICSTEGSSFNRKKITDSTSFCAAALETVHVNLVQGSAFGAEGYVRLSFATSREAINKGVDKLAEFLQG